MLLFSLFTFLFALNVLTFGLYAIDKRNAYYGRWRIPEAVLLGLTVIGGGYGAGAGMMLFRHKTRHKAFLITVPVFLAIWLIALIVMCVVH